MVVPRDKQRRNMHAALEAIENAFDPVFVPIAQDRIGQRQPLLGRVGDKGPPAEPGGAGGDGVFLTSRPGMSIAVIAGTLAFPPFLAVPLTSVLSTQFFTL